MGRASGPRARGVRTRSAAHNKVLHPRRPSVAPLWEEVSGGRWGLFDGESADGHERARATAFSRAYPRAGPGRVLKHASDDAASTLRLSYQAGGQHRSTRVVPSGGIAAPRGDPTELGPRGP